MLTNLQAAHAGTYRVVVTNAYGIAMSTIVSVAVSATDPFNPGTGGGYVESLAVQPDGKILAGGLFTRLGGQTRPYVGRVNADGTLDSAFNPSPNNWVNCLAALAGGQIVVGGSFSSLGGQPRRSIGQLTADGNLDISFDPSTNSSSYLNCLAVQPDGKVLAGGSFSALRRLNADGTRDNSFNVSVGGYLYCMALQPDGKIIVGGGFTTLAGLARTNIARLNVDGTLDTSFNSIALGQINSTWGSGVIALAMQPDGKILVGGNFAMLGGRLHQGLGRLNTNGTLDTNFTAVADGIVHTFALQADGKILVGGRFAGLRSGTNIMQLLKRHWAA